MNRQRFCAMVLLLSIVAVLSAGGRPQVAADPVSSFKEIAARHIASYETNHRVSISLYGGYQSPVTGTVTPSRWARQWFDAEPKYSVDVQSTNSLISPYVGIFEFKLHRYLSKMWDTKEEAEKDTTAIDTFLIKHKHIFAFQDKKWVPTERQHFTERPLYHTESLNRWRDCNEINPDGETDMFGCHEDLTSQIAPRPTPKPQAPRSRKRPH